MSTAIIRNGHKLCVKCRDKGCMTQIGWDWRLPDNEQDYESDEPCSCCEQDIELEIDDGFGI